MYEDMTEELEPSDDITHVFCTAATPLQGRHMVV